MNVENGIQIGELLAIARRRLNIVLGVAIVVALAGYWLTMSLPNEYQSYATVLVEPQAVAPELVAAGVPRSDLNRRLGIMTSQILSRPRLSRVIDDLGLYKAESESMMRQSIIDFMRASVRVEPVVPEMGAGSRGAGDFEINTFRIVFTDRNAQTAKMVAERLSNDFIQEHIEARVEVSQKSLDFIQTELDRLSEEIRGVERSVAEVKEGNPGRLPDDINANRNRLEKITADLAFSQRAYSEARSDEAFFRSQAATAATMTIGGDDQSPARRRQMLELAIADYKSRGFTDKHPDVITAKAQLKAAKETIANSDSEEDPNPPTNFAQQSAESEAHRASLRRSAAEEAIARLEVRAAETNELLAGTPVVAEKLDALERRYQHLFRSYQDFSNRQLEATVQAQLERRQLGEQFRVLEAAFAAPKPTSPNRGVLLMMSLIFGMALGGVAGVVFEISDTSIHSVRQLQNAVRIPVLAAIPKILLESDRRQLRRKRIRIGIATTAVVAISLAGGAASYFWVNGGQAAGGMAGSTAGKPSGGGATRGAEG